MGLNQFVFKQIRTVTDDLCTADLVLVWIHLINYWGTKSFFYVS